MKKLLLIYLLLICVSNVSKTEQTNISDLIDTKHQAVSVYEDAHIVSDCDSTHLKKKAHFYSQALKRQRQDSDRQLNWMQGCVKGYENNLPVYDTSCVLALKESEEEQRERVGDSINNGLQSLGTAILFFKGLGGL